MQRALFLLISVLLMSTLGANAQAMKMDHWSKAELLERAKHLQSQAAESGGSASETLENYPHHYTMLAYRASSGGGELHQHFADIFYILDGHATLLTGGRLMEQKTTAPGEIRGKSLEGGDRQELTSGDVVHIPAGMPHQMLLSHGDSITYFVIKVEESRPGQGK